MSDKATTNAGIDNRKDLIMLVLAAADGDAVVGVTRLQKYLFLLQEAYGWTNKYPIVNPYQFEAYDFGPFDSQIYDDLDFLRNTHFVEALPAGSETGAENEEMRQQSSDWGTSDPEFQPWEEEDQVLQYSLSDRGREFVRQMHPLPEDAAVLEGIREQDVRRSLGAVRASCPFR